MRTPIEVISVCRVREECELGCRGCEYVGGVCNHTIDKLGVDRPSHYVEEMEEKER